MVKSLEKKKKKLEIFQILALSHADRKFLI